MDDDRQEGHVCTDACAELSPTNWIDDHRVISQGPERGQLMQADLAPFLLEILNFAIDPWATEGCVRKAARIGYTEGVLGTAIAYTIACDPCAIAVLQPTDTEAKDYSRENILPMIGLTRALHDKIGTEFDHLGMGQRSQSTSMTFKAFPGGNLIIVGSAAGVKLRRRSIKRAFADEIDGMKADVREGDPLARYKKRTGDYVGHGGVMLAGSTPTTIQLSIIEKRWVSSDQRFWTCPCPHCKDEKIIEWKHIRWEKEVVCGNCEKATPLTGTCPHCGFDDKKVTHLADTAHWVCSSCGGMVAESEKADFIRSGKWVPTSKGKYPGWHVPAYISLFGMAAWPILADEFLEANEKAKNGDKEFLQVFTNTVLGEPWIDKDRLAKVTGLEDRTEQYTNAMGELIMVPDGVGILTAGVDVQHDRVELLVRGWGMEDESYDVLHQRIWGKPDFPAVWNELDAFLTKPYTHVSGLPMRIVITFVDSGDKTAEVYKFTKPRQGRRVFATKGDQGARGAAPVKRSQSDLSRRGKKHQTLAERLKVPLYTIGTYTQKDTLVERLGIDEPGPGYIHLRAQHPDLCNGFDAGYFKQFEAESKHLIRTGRDGKPDLRWVKIGKRNEAIDLHVLNQAAFDAIDVRQQMAKRVELASKGKAPATRHRRQKGIIHSGI